MNPSVKGHSQVGGIGEIPPPPPEPIQKVKNYKGPFGFLQLRRFSSHTGLHSPPTLQTPRLATSLHSSIDCYGFLFSNLFPKK